MAIHEGSEVTIHFELKTADGRVVESTHQRGDAVTFQLGDGHLPASFEHCLLGLNAGDKGQWELAPEQAFGVHNPDQVAYLERTQFPDDIELEVGLVMGFTMVNGDEVPGIITALEGDSVTADLNHPLAGETILFSVEVLACHDANSNQEV